MEGNGKSEIDPLAGQCVVMITYDPVSKQIQVQTRNMPDDTAMFGIIEMAKAAMIIRKANHSSENVVVPVRM